MYFLLGYCSSNSLDSEVNSNTEQHGESLLNKMERLGLVICEDFLFNLK